jgi:hypothetical protein
MIIGFFGNLFKSSSGYSAIGKKTGGQITINEAKDKEEEKYKKLDQNLKGGLQYLINRKRNVLTFVLLVFLVKPILHFSFSPDISQEIDFNNKKYVDGYVTEGWYYKDRNGLEPNKCIDDFDERGVKYDCMTLYQAARSSWPQEFAFTKNGERYRLEKGTSNLDLYGNITTVYYYPFMNLSFMTHLSLLFESKLWIFAISFGSMLLLVFLFNDKIKVR